MAKYDANQIANLINADGKTYYGESAKGWVSENVSRIYFGREYVTIENDGRVHNDIKNKPRASSIGYSAVEIVEEVIASMA